ncbi:MAG TPA: PVC-type heme-binding CxxCH protein, partial [Planctomycetaceae bacterium]|nr:PVC-type heme-binding CxxCH protein [Planctomycetaceae bacterium]
MRFLFSALLCLLSITAGAADDFIPRRQDKPPGPPLSPQKAISKMTVPAGFSVELVASEPQVINPVGMAIDEKGRFWITESFEYPRREPGPGRDRVKVLEDTDGDGKVDKVTVFAEGLNIPSGIAVGHGGVWVANSPDILFMQDTDGDLKADKIEKIVTGFGRTDTHELPNSLTWGPDGWLYGLNGVFNYCNVSYAEENPNYKQGQPSWEFTCALFRIHPRTREFQLFAEGTSNPWGIAFNDNGEAFLSACVIDHLWHLSESGYYHRQGGPYPPHTWKIDSIVKHTHQLAAYCGIHYYDADAYPEEYRGKLYMGNIHGNCINSDALERDGSTYFGTARPDFLSANDVWFMPVVQKTGPDGCLYILDWYDRYHCYQDANRDPEGIDRGHGRLYRVRYNNTPHTPAGFDMGSESDGQLLERLSQHNDFIRGTAQRLLAERSNPETRKRLEQMVFNYDHDRQTRLFAAWTVFSMQPEPGHPLLDSDFVEKLKAQPDATLRAWAVRAAGDQYVSSWTHTSVNESEEMKLFELADWAIGDESADVRLQGVILAGRHARKLQPYTSYTDLFGEALLNTPNDKLFPKILWRNLLYYLERYPEQSAGFATTPKIADRPEGQQIVSRLVAWLLDRKQLETEAIAKIITHYAAGEGG